MLQVCVHDLNKLYREIPKDSIGQGWKTQLAHVDWRNLHKRRWFLKNVLCVEDASANAALEATDPIQAFFSASYSIPALRRLQKTVAVLSREAIRALADDAAATLAAYRIRVPKREALEEAAFSAVWNAIGKGTIGYLTHIARDAAIADLTAEFRRLCRLEGEYGETMRA